MIKLKDLLKESWWDDLNDKAQQAYIKRHGEAPNVAGDDEKKDKKPKKKHKTLPGITTPSHPDSPSQTGATITGPQDDDDAVGTPGDAAKERAIISAVIDLVRTGEDANLCDEKYSVPGSNLFCGVNKGYPREKMPQLKSKPKPGGKLDDMIKNGEIDEKYIKRDDDGEIVEVNTEKMFLEEIGKDAPEEVVKVTDLKATQTELDGNHVSFFLNQLQNGDPDSEFTKALLQPIIVARNPETGEMYIVDGHHRWAALVAQDIANGGDGDIEMKVKVIAAPIEEVVEQANDFTEDMGLETKSAGDKKEEVVQPFAELYYRMKK
jgi:hypothetical protein